MFKNMKIEINEQQPLDEVVKELERIGYVQWFNPMFASNILISFSHGMYDGVDSMDELIDPFKFKSTTLTELRSMNIEILKEMEM